MSFRDRAIILEARAYGESAAVAHVLTETRGAWAGLVHGGQGRRKKPILQPGNEVALEWKGREGALGHFSVELARPHAAVALDDALALAGLSAACAIARSSLAEGEAQRGVFDGLQILLSHLETIEVWPILMARFELGLLAALGFGLTLDRCAATGARERLIYVSPRSAQAVSEEAGAPYREKLLPMPTFLVDPQAGADLLDAAAALELTGYFLETRVLHLKNQPLPPARARLPQKLRAHAA